MTSTQTPPHTESDYSAGVMGADYADGRITKPHLKFRLKVRAEVALGGYQKFHPKQNPNKVLSLGAAEGATLLYLNDLIGGQGQLDGIELSDELLGAAPPMPSNVSLIKGNVMDLPEDLEEGSYDLVIALAVLEHLSDPLMCVREAYRMLRPGGVFVATCPHPFWDDVAGKFGLVKDEHHESAVNLERMQAFCRGAGFSKVSGDPFMWVVTGFLPYLGINLNPTLSLRIDSLIRFAKPFHFSFVNQVVVAQK